MQIIIPNPKDNYIRKSVRTYSNYLGGYTVVGIAEDNEIKQLIDVRFYQPNYIIYCALWVLTPNYHLCGGGAGSSFGTTLKAEALSEALFTAGIANTGINDHLTSEEALLKIAAQVNNLYELNFKPGSFAVFSNHP